MRVLWIPSTDFFGRWYLVSGCNVASTAEAHAYAPEHQNGHL